MRFYIVAFWITAEEKSHNECISARYYLEGLSAFGAEMRLLIAHKHSLNVSYRKSVSLVPPDDSSTRDLLLRLYGEICLSEPLRASGLASSALESRLSIII